MVGISHTLSDNVLHKNVVYVHSYNKRNELISICRNNWPMVKIYDRSV